MKLYMAVPVYKGGEYWKEAWKSILENLDFFEGVYISVNKSELQEQDAETVRTAPEEASSRIHMIRQDRLYSAIDHAARIYEWLKKQLPDEGHLMFFCHDDILCRKGMEELSALELKENEACFGSFRFFDEDRKKQEITCRLFYRPSGKPMERDEFAGLLYQSLGSISLSGLVMPVHAFKKRIPVFNRLFYGWGAEHLRLVNPYVEKIRQTYEPLARIREHSGSEGAQLTRHRFAYMKDIFYVGTLSFLAVHAETARMTIVRSLGYILRRNPLFGLAAWFLVQFTFLRLGLFPASLKPIPLLWIQVSGRIRTSYKWRFRRW